MIGKRVSKTDESDNGQFDTGKTEAKFFTPWNHTPLIREEGLEMFLREAGAFAGALGQYAAEGSIIVCRF